MATKAATIRAEFKAIEAALKALVPLDPRQRSFALEMILHRLELPPRKPSIDDGAALDGIGAGRVAGAASGGGAGGDGAVATKSMTAKDFLKHKNPTTDLERFLCLAYYLDKNRGVTKFSTRDITNLNSEAGGVDFSNAAATSMNAMRQSRMLSKAGGGKKQINNLGEALVNALPDRVKAKEVVKSRPVRRKRKRRPRKVAKS